MLEAMKYGTVIRREAEGRGGRAVVIVARPDEPHLPFVVWYEDVNAMQAALGNEAVYYTGSYCATLTEACTEFTRRTNVEA